MAADTPETEIEPGSSPPADGGVEPSGPSQDEAPLTLREEIEAAAREVRGETDKPADERPRDATGRFIPKAEDAKATPGTAARTPASLDATSAPSSPATTSGTPAAPSTAPAGPPPGWDAEAKALYPKLPPAIQAAVSRREEEVSRGFAQYAQAKQELERVIAPRRQYYSGDGVSDTQAIDNIWKWFEALKNSPNEALPALAQMFGATISSGAPADSPQVNPEVAALRAHIQRLEGQVGQVAGTFEQQQTAARRAEIAEFAKDKPHFEKVRVTMGRLMSAGVAQGLTDAYQQAVRITPEVSAALAAEEKASADKVAAEAALRSRPGSQRRAAVSVRGGSPNGSAGAAVPAGSLREELQRQFAEARGG